MMTVSYVKNNDQFLNFNDHVVGVVLGMQETSYTMRESEVTVNVCVEMMNGEAAIPVEVTLSLFTGQPNNAQGI